MKVPPKRKGNRCTWIPGEKDLENPSMKVPPKRKGNWGNSDGSVHVASALNESPSEKEGKCGLSWLCRTGVSGPSMKVPPKRKGN